MDNNDNILLKAMLGNVGLQWLTQHWTCQSWCKEKVSLCGWLTFRDENQPSEPITSRCDLRVLLRHGIDIHKYHKLQDVASHVELQEVSRLLLLLLAGVCGSIAKKINHRKIQVSREHLEAQVFGVRLWESTSSLNREHAVNGSLRRIGAFGLGYKSLQTILQWEWGYDAFHAVVLALVFHINVQGYTFPFRIVQKLFDLGNTQKIPLQISCGEAFRWRALQIHSQVGKVSLPHKSQFE